MNSVELPYVEPMFSTFLWHSNAGIPAKQNQTSDIWYYNNMIDWNCSTKFLNGFTTPEINIPKGSIWDLPFLEKNGISNRFVCNCSNEIIKNMLDNGYYVAFDGIDDFYLKGKSWYNKRHFLHDGLITGYDGAKTFTIAAYDERWIFTSFKTPQTCFDEGLNAPAQKNQFGSLIAIKANNDVQKLDIERIRNELEKYLDSNIKKFPVTTAENVFGIMVYDYICMYLDKLMDGSIPHERQDRRIFRLIWEHKKCMMNRILAIEDAFGLENDVSSEYKDIVDLADKARFIYSKFVLKYSAKHLEMIQSIIVTIKRGESDILAPFLNVLSRLCSL